MESMQTEREGKAEASLLMTYILASAAFCAVEVSQESSLHSRMKGYTGRRYQRLPVPGKEQAHWSPFDLFSCPEWYILPLITSVIR